MSNGSTWNNVDPYLGCNSRHFVDFVSTTTDAGGRRVYTSGPVHQVVIDPRFGVFSNRSPQQQPQTPQQQQQTRQSGSAANSQSSGPDSRARANDARGAAPPGGGSLLSDILNSRFGFNVGAFEGMMTDMQGNLNSSLIVSFDLPPMGTNVIFDSFIICSEILESDDLVRAVVMQDHSVLDRLRSPLRDLFRRRLEERYRQTPASPTQLVHRMVDEALKDRAFLDHPVISNVNSTFAEWLSERNGLPPRSSDERPIDWVATVRRMMAAYSADIMLLTMDSPTDIGFGQLLFDEELTSSYQEVRLF